MIDLVDDKEEPDTIKLIAHLLDDVYGLKILLEGLEPIM